MRKVFFSQSFDFLAQFLQVAFESSCKQGFSIQKQSILVPSHSLKHWLLLRWVEKRSPSCILGFEIFTFEEYIRSICPEIPTRLALLSQMEMALTPLSYPELASFLAKAPHHKQSLTRHLAPLFFLYLWNLYSCEEGWQGRLFRELKLKSIFEKASQALDERKEPLHIFGFSFLPQMLLSPTSSKAPCYFYQFSPCAEFWEDVCTEKEGHRLLTFWKKKRASEKNIELLETYLQDAPPLLANWGKVGRETIKALGDLETENFYPPPLSETALGALQREILFFEKKQIQDASISVCQGGQTKQEEVEALQKKVRSLVSQNGWNYSDILILAPEIEPYVPWITMIFSKEQIPFRFPKLSFEKQSFFFQGLAALFALAREGLQEAPFLSLLEISSKKREWRIWAEQVFQEESWEKGSFQTFARFLMLLPGPKTEAPSLGEWDSLEEFASFLYGLSQDVSSLKDQKKTLSDWADVWRELLRKYLPADFSQDVDPFARQKVDQIFIEMKKLKLEALFPLSFVEDALLQPLFRSQNMSELHAATCSSLEEGAIFPAKAIFLLGMDEESFPRASDRSMLNQMPPSTYIPEAGEIDRYLLLQALMSASHVLCMSYLHESSEDGRKRNPSFLIQQLCADRAISLEEREKRRPISSLQPTLSFSSLEIPPLDEARLDLEDLCLFARHPWRYYLQKVLRVFLPREGARSIRKERGSLLRFALQWPLEGLQEKKWPGLLQEAFIEDTKAREKLRKQRLEEWNQRICPIDLLATCGNAVSLELEGGRRALITGHIPWALEKGALHLGDDHLSSVLSVWPEILTTLVFQDASELYILKSGKVKQICQAKKALAQFVEYYLRCRETLSPLLPDWADSLLRKSPDSFSGEFQYKDPVCQWVQFRLGVLCPKELFEDWKWLKDSFAELIELYPCRSR